MRNFQGIILYESEQIGWFSNLHLCTFKAVSVSSTYYDFFFFACLSYWTLNIPFKWLSVHLETKWLWIRDPSLSDKFQISHLFQASNSLAFRQLQSLDSLQTRICNMIKTHHFSIMLYIFLIDRHISLP